MPSPAEPKLGSEVVVVLGSGVERSVLRAKAAAEFAKEHPDVTVVLCGGRTEPNDASGTTEADRMANTLEKEGVSKDRLLLEKWSRDTTGNAVFFLILAAKLLLSQNSRVLHLFTSPFHMKRALLIFRHVLGPHWEVVGHPSEVGSADEPEPLGLELTERYFADIEPGDLRAIVAKLIAVGNAVGKNYFSSLTWLAEAADDAARSIEDRRKPVTSKR